MVHFNVSERKKNCDKEFNLQKKKRNFILAQHTVIRFHRCRCFGKLDTKPLCRFAFIYKLSYSRYVSMMSIILHLGTCKFYYIWLAATTRHTNTNFCWKNFSIENPQKEIVFCFVTDSVRCRFIIIILIATYFTLNAAIY